MTILEAAYAVLARAGEPLNNREIAERMLADGWQTRGKTLWDSVSARISVDLQEHGSESRFTRTKRGHYGLNPAAPERLGVVEAQATAKRRPAGPAGRDGSDRLSFLDAAERILRESGDREPLHYGLITQRALDYGLIRTQGRTPADTMLAMIYTETKRRESRGEAPRFVRHGRGLVGLARWEPMGLTASIAEQNAGVRGALLDRARGTSPAEFESLVERLLVAMGFEDAAVTPLGGDGGIDVRGTLVVGDAVRIRMAVQAKRWRSNVGSPIVQQVRGSLGAHEQGLIITTSDFSSGAKEEATRADATPVALMNGEQLAAQLVEHEIGVRRETYDLLTLEETESEE